MRATNPVHHPCQCASPCALVRVGGVKGLVHAGELSAVTSSVRALQADIEAIDSRLTKRFDSAEAKMLEIQAATEVLEDQEVTAATAACNVMGALEVQAAHCAALAAETDRVQGMLRQLEHQESALLHQACWRDAPGRYRAVTRQPPRLACPSLHPRLRTTCECKCRCLVFSAYLSFYGMRAVSASGCDVCGSALVAQAALQDIEHEHLTLMAQLLSADKGSGTTDIPRLAKLLTFDEWRNHRSRAGGGRGSSETGHGMTSVEKARAVREARLARDRDRAAASRASAERPRQLEQATKDAQRLQEVGLVPSAASSCSHVPHIHPIVPHRTVT